MIGAQPLGDGIGADRARRRAYGYASRPEPRSVTVDAGVLEMLRTLNAVVDEHGNVRLLEAINLPAGRRLLVTVLADGQPDDEAVLLSEGSLAADWDRPEEDVAWSHLQRAR